MKSKKAHILFALAFTAFLITPAVMTLVNERVQVDLFSANEEESEQENELRKLLELDEYSSQQGHITPHPETKKLDLNDYLLSFEELHLESIYPPPEHL